MTQIFRLGLYTPAWPGSSTPNGIATAVYNLARGLCDLGHRPVIVTPRIDGDVTDGILVFETTTDWTLLEKLKARIGVPDVAQAVMGRQISDAFLLAHQTHALHAIIMEETHGWVGKVQAEIPIPVIATLHGPWFMHKTLQSQNGPATDRRRMAREAKALLNVAGITAPSKDVMDATLAEIPLLNDHKTSVIRNALTGDDNHTSASQPTDKILFVGRYDRHKGGDVVLNAFAELAQINKDVELTFVGPDRGVAQPDGSITFIDDALDALPTSIRARINYMGQQDRNSIAVLRKTHSVAVIASRYENLNYTMLEAMAAGQALVATNVGGPREVLEHDTTALLVAPDNATELADALKMLFKSPALQVRLGKAAQDTLKRDFHPSTIARETLEFSSSVK